MYTCVVSFYPPGTSRALHFHQPNTVLTNTHFRRTGSNRESVVLVALFKDGFQRDQAEWPFCLIVHFLQCDGGRQDIFQLRVIITLLLLYWLSNSQLTVCPLDPKTGREKRLHVLCVFVCVNSPCGTKITDLKTEVKGRGGEGVVELSSSSLLLTPGRQTASSPGKTNSPQIIILRQTEQHRCMTCSPVQHGKDLLLQSCKGELNKCSEHMLICTHMLSLTHTRTYGHTHTFTTDAAPALDH